MAPESRPSSPFMSLSKARKRARIREILGDDYVEDATQVLKHPKPLPNIEDYDLDRIKMSLQYSDCTFRNPHRRLSPLGTRILEDYEYACVRILVLAESETQDIWDGARIAKEEWTENIRRWEESMIYSACFHFPCTEGEQKLLDELVHMKRVMLYARYGRYLSDACKEPKHGAKSHEIPGLRTLPRAYWTEIYNRIQNEKQPYEEALKRRGDMAKCRIHMEIFHVCQRTGFNMDDVLENIHHYVVHNELMRINLVSFIKDDFHGLSERLHDDFCDVACLMPHIEGVPSEVIQTLIETIIDLWFDRYWFTEDYSRSWIPNDSLRSKRRALIGNGDETLVNKVSEDIAQEINRKMRMAQRDKNKVRGFLEHAPEHLRLFPSRTQFVISSALENELEAAEKMMNDNETIMALSLGSRKFSACYVERIGGLAPRPQEILGRSI